MNKNKYIIITGASAGIGKAQAYKFASEGYSLIISARREASLNEIKAEIEREYNVNVEVYPADLSDSQSVLDFYEFTKGFDSLVLINNAGFGDFNAVWDFISRKNEYYVRPKH